MTNHTLAMNGALAMSRTLHAPGMSPSLAIIVALDALGGNKPSRQPAAILAVLVNAARTRPRGRGCEGARGLVRSEIAADDV